MYQIKLKNNLGEYLLLLSSKLLKMLISQESAHLIPASQSSCHRLALNALPAPRFALGGPFIPILVVLP